jgi:hypothetical protein
MAVKKANSFPLYVRKSRIESLCLMNNAEWCEEVGEIAKNI